MIINSLRPAIVKEIFLKAFNIRVKLSTLQRDLNIIREVRNKIAHAEQMLIPKGTYLKTGTDQYIFAIMKYIKKSNFKKFTPIIQKYFDDYKKIVKKYKK